MRTDSDPWAVHAENIIPIKKDGMFIARYCGCRLVIDPVNKYFECINCNDDTWRSIGKNTMQDAVEEHLISHHKSFDQIPFQFVVDSPGMFAPLSLEGHSMIYYHDYRFLTDSVKKKVQCLICEGDKWHVFGDENLEKVLEQHVSKHHSRVKSLAQVK